MATVAQRTKRPPTARREPGPGLPSALLPLTPRRENETNPIQASHENPHAAFPAGSDRGRLARGRRAVQYSGVTQHHRRNLAARRREPARQSHLPDQGRRREDLG